MKILFNFLVIFIFSIALFGCLTYESKEYSFTLKEGNSGSAKIKYINIMREITEDTASTAESSYEDLINNYLYGNKPEDEMLGVKNVSKRLFEENNQLCGEITFDFDNIEDFKFYNYNYKVWAYLLSEGSVFGTNEQFFSSNGTFGGELVPVIFWDYTEREFNFKTVVPQNNKNNESLLQIWKNRQGK